MVFREPDLNAEEIIAMRCAVASKPCQWMDGYIHVCVCTNVLCMHMRVFISISSLSLMFPFNIRDYYWFHIDLVSVTWTVKWFSVTRTWLLIWFPCCKHTLASELKSIWWEKGNMWVHNLLVGGGRELPTPPSSIGGGQQMMLKIREYSSKSVI